MIDKTIIICEVEGSKAQTGYRQLGLIGNIVSTHSYRDCTPVLTHRNWFKTLVNYHNCMVTNAKTDQQNINALTAKLLELTKR